MKFGEYAKANMPTTNTMTGLWLKQSKTAYRLIMIGYSQMKSGLLLVEKNWQKVRSSPFVH